MVNAKDGTGRPSDYNGSSSRAEDRDNAEPGKHGPQGSYPDILEVIKDEQSDDSEAGKSGWRSFGEWTSRLVRRTFKRRFLLRRLAGYVPSESTGPRDCRLHSVVGGAMVLASGLFGLAGYILTVQHMSGGGWVTGVMVAVAADVA